MRGKRTKFANVIISEGVSVGRAENNVPSEAKQKDDNGMLIIRTFTLTIPAPNKRIPIIIGITTKRVPNNKPDTISPTRIECNETGVEINRSKVFVLLSHGAMTGVTDEAVKKTVREIIPGTRACGGRFLPTENARNRKNGKRIPKIRTGPFK
jgi:hypothetical protein